MNWDWTKDSWLKIPLGRGLVSFTNFDRSISSHKPPWHLFLRNVDKRVLRKTGADGQKIKLNGIISVTTPGHVNIFLRPSIQEESGMSNAWTMFPN